MVRASASAWFVVAACFAVPITRPGLAVHAQTHAPAQDDAAVAKQFLGMWKLVSWTQRTADGATRPGTTDTGYLVYTDVGRMCAVMMDSTRAKWALEPPKTVPEAMARSAGFVSYCASVEVHARDGFVLHHVDVERNPGIVGTIRKRGFTFQGPDRLILKVDPAELQASTVESTLVWERVRK